MRKQHHIRLTREERAAAAILAGGTHAALTTRHARILLEGDEAPGQRRRSDRQVGELCGVSARTVARVRECFATHGFAVAVHGHPHPGGAPKLAFADEARLIALACSPAPAGHARWSLRLLAELEIVPPVSRELVRRTLKKTPSRPGGCGGG
jgi:hypothetical protein